MNSRRAPWTMHLPGTSIARALKADRPLALAFALLSVGALVPLVATPVLPFPDLASNVAGASLLVRTALHQAAVMPFYRVEWLPLPYWTTYLFVGTANLVVGPFLAAKLLVAIVVLLLPLAMLRLSLALGRDPRVSLWGFLVCWEHNLFAGWHAYALGMAIGLVVLAKLVEVGDDVRAARWVIPWSALLALTHAMASLFVVVAGALLLASPRITRRRAQAALVALSGTTVILVAWLAVRALRSSADGPPAAWHFDYPTASQKVSGLFAYSLDDLTGPFAEIRAALAFGLLVLAPIAFLVARCTTAAVADDPLRWSGAKLALAGLLLYASLPMAIYGPLNHWYTYPRYASYLLLALPLVPPVRRLAPAWLLPVIAVALAGNLATVIAFSELRARVRPFVQLVDAVPAGARLLPLEYVDQDPTVKSSPLAHLHSYMTAKGLYDPHMFDNQDTPVRYKDGLPMPRISWLGPRGFTLAKYAPHYDYILVQGIASDPFPAHPAEGGYRVRLLEEAGMWRLYKVEPP